MTCFDIAYIGLAPDLLSATRRFPSPFLFRFDTGERRRREIVFGDKIEEDSRACPTRKPEQDAASSVRWRTETRVERAAKLVGDKRIEA